MGHGPGLGPLFGVLTLEPVEKGPQAGIAERPVLRRCLTEASLGRRKASLLPSEQLHGQARQGVGLGQHGHGGL